LPAGTHEFAVDYRFAPGEADDGATLEVPLSLLGSLDAARLAWGVPGQRLELVTALIRGLPKPLRRPLVPAPASAASVLGDADTSRPMWAELSRLLSRLAGHAIGEHDLTAVPLADHLRFNLRVVGDDGRVLAQGRDLAALRARLRGAREEALRQSTRGFARKGLRDWDFGSLAPSVTIDRGSLRVVVHPALQDENGIVSLTAFEDPAEAELAHRAGVRRLLVLALADPLKHARKALAQDRELALLQQPAGPLAELAGDICDRAVERVCLPASGPAVRDRTAFERSVDRGRGLVYDEAIAIAGRAKAALQAARDARSALAGLPSSHEPTIAADCRRELDRLGGPRFVATTPDPWLDELPRLLTALKARVTRLGEGRNLAAQRELVAWRERLSILTDRPLAGELEWMLAEYCVSLFAQQLGTSVPVSAKRLEQRLSAARK
jgi:ATP-dependent helicase HrpA